MLFASLSWAQTYPSKPIRLVVPFAPGGSSTLVARLVTDEMAKGLGGSFVIENKGGGGGKGGTSGAAGRMMSLGGEGGDDGTGGRTGGTGGTGGKGGSGGNGAEGGDGGGHGVQYGQQRHQGEQAHVRQRRSVLSTAVCRETPGEIASAVSQFAEHMPREFHGGIIARVAGGLHGRPRPRLPRLPRLPRWLCYTRTPFNEHQRRHPA